MEFVALIVRFYLPHQIASDFDEIQVSRKQRFTAFNRCKSCQNPVRSDGVNGRRKVAHNFVLKERNMFQIFIPLFLKEKYFGNFLCLEPPNYFSPFARRKMEYFPFSLEIYLFIKKQLSGRQFRFLPSPEFQVFSCSWVHLLQASS